MKIALVLESFDVAKGGAERSTFEMALCLSQLDMDVTIVARNVSGISSRDFPFHIHPIPVSAHSKKGQWMAFEKALEEFFSSNRFDIIHSMVPIKCADIYQPRGGSILHSQQRHWASFGQGAKTTFKKLTNGFNRSRGQRLLNERAICDLPDKPILVALSNYVLNQFKTLYGVPEKRLHLVCNGVHINRLKNDQAVAEGEKLKKLYDPQGNTSLLLFAAENLRLKGLDYLIEAARIVRDQLKGTDKEFRLFVMTGSDWSSYWKKSNGYQLNENILFMGSSDQMPAMLNMCDAVVLPTFNDACSRVVLEGLAVNKPAITTQYNGAVDFLEDGEYGQVIDEPTNVDALSKAILKYCEKATTQLISQRIEEDHLFDQVSMFRHAKELIQLYGKLTFDAEEKTGQKIPI